MFSTCHVPNLCPTYLPWRLMNLPLLSTLPATPQEVSAQVGGEAAMSSDLTILAAAASQLFECTRDMSREAVVSLLSGLRDVSLRNIPSAGAAVGQVRGCGACGGGWEFGAAGACGRGACLHLKTA